MLQQTKNTKTLGNTIVNFPIFVPLSPHFLCSTILKYTLSQSVCSIHHTYSFPSSLFYYPWCFCIQDYFSMAVAWHLLSFCNTWMPFDSSLAAKEDGVLFELKFFSVISLRTWLQMAERVMPWLYCTSSLLQSCTDEECKVIKSFTISTISRWKSTTDGLLTFPLVPVDRKTTAVN